MTCEKCGGHNLYTLDSRQAQSGIGQKRRRECADCGTRVTTYEVTKKEYDLILQSKKMLMQVRNMLERFEEGKKASEDKAKYPI